MTPVTREKKYVGLHPHVFEQAINRKLFESVQEARDIIVNAVKHSGVFVPQPEENKLLCLFKHKDKYVTMPVFETENAFMCITMWESNEWEKGKYNLEKLKLINREEEM